jgi:hypothetical protein
VGKGGIWRRWWIASEYQDVVAGFTRQEANHVPLWPGSFPPLFIYWPVLYSHAYNHNPNKPSLSLIS